TLSNPVNGGAAGPGFIRIHNDSTVHLDVVDLNPASTHADGAVEIRGRIESFGEDPVGRSCFQSRIVCWTRCAVLADNVQDRVKLGFAVRTHDDLRVAGVRLGLPDLEPGDLIRP